MKNGDNSMKASSANANAKICSNERFSPLTRPSSWRSVTVCFCTSGLKSAAGVSSSTTPVKAFETSAVDKRRTPRAGSWITTPLAVTVVNTTKWFNSQCSTQGNCNCDRWLISARSARGVNCICAAMRVRSAKVAPFSDSGKRRRSVGKSVCRPWCAATIAKHAKPHSAASVCSINGARRRNHPRCSAWLITACRSH